MSAFVIQTYQQVIDVVDLYFALGVIEGFLPPPKYGGEAQNHYHFRRFMMLAITCCFYRSMLTV